MIATLRRVLRYDLPIVIALFILPLAFFWQVTLGNRTLLPADNLYQYQPWASYREQQGVPAVSHNSLLSDLVLENLPWKQFIRDSLTQRELPLWNPYLFSGVPFLAAGQHSALYPFSLIYYVLPLEKAYGWFTVSQLWLAGFLMYLFMRGLGVGRFGSTIAAIAYQLSGFFIASVVFQMIIAAAAWLPFLLLMVEFTIRQRPFFGRSTPIPWIALGALGLGMEILAGHVEFTYYALLVMGFWALCRLLGLALNRSPEKRLPLSKLVRTGFSLIALVVLGLGIGAIQFVPLFELSSQNFREGSASFDQVRDYAFPPRHALAFLMPNLFGSPAQHDYFDVFTGQQTAVDWIVAPDPNKSDNSQHVMDTFWDVKKNYVEGACYVGLLTLFLAGVALLNARFERAPHARIESAGPYRLILAILALISLTFIFGTITYAILYYGLPGINQLHSPFRWVFPLTLCLAALAGFGAEALQRARGESTFGREYWRATNVSFTFRLAKRLGYTLIGVGVVVLIGLLASRLFFDQLRGPLVALMNKLAGASATFPNVETFYSVSFRPILFFGLFLVACGCVIRVSRCPIYLPRRFGKHAIWQTMALITLILDLVVAAAGFNPAADPAWLQFTPPAITWLQKQNPQEWRFVVLETPGHSHTLNANAAWRYKLQDIGGYDSIIPKQYVQYMETLEPQSQLGYNRIAPLYPDHLDALDAFGFSALSAKYVISETEIDTAQYPQYKQAYKDDAVFIYENTAARPRAYTVPRTACNAVTESSPIDNTVQLTEARNNQVSADAKTSSDSCLVLADSYFPGWRAYFKPQGSPDSDEKEITVSKVLGNFRGVIIPAGNWTVRFRYSPQAVQIGGFLSFISAVILIFAMLILLWRMFYTEDEQNTASGIRRLAKNSIAPIVLSLFVRAIDFVFALIMMRILGPESVGTYYTVVVVWGWFDTVTNFGLNLYLTREVARNRAAAGRYLLNSSVLRLLLAGAGLPVLLLYCFIRVRVGANVDPAFVPALVLLYIGLIPNSISYGLAALCYAFEKAEIPAATSTISAILKTILGLGVLLAGWNVIGLATVSIILNLVTLSILGWQARALLRENHRKLAQLPNRFPADNEAERAVVDRSLLRQMIFASWPLMLNNLLAGVFFKIDVTILDPEKGPDVVAQYGAAYKWLDALGVIPSLFTMALLPVMSRQAKDDKPALERSYHFAVKLLFSIALPTAIGITFLAPIMMNVLGGQNYVVYGTLALQLMVWFIPIGWINSLTNYVLIALDQQHAMRWAFAIGVGFNLIANLIFIPTYSFVASAIITVLSEVVLQIAFYRLLRKALAPVPWYKIVLKPLIAGVAMMIALAILRSMLPLNAALITVPLAGILYLSILVVLRPFSEWERERLAALLPRQLRRFVYQPAVN